MSVTEVVHLVGGGVPHRVVRRISADGGLITACGQPVPLTATFGDPEAESTCPACLAALEGAQP